MIMKKYQNLLGKFLLLLIIFFVAFYLPKSMSQSSLQSKEQTFDAESVEIENFSGRLKIVAESRPDFSVQISGAEEDLKDIKLNVSNNTLIIRDQRTIRRGGSVVSVGNITTIATGGGTASVNIGGQEFTTRGNNNPLVEMTLLLPQKIPLVIRKFNGDCQIGNINGKLEIDMASGHCDIGEITKGKLEINGSGNLTVNQVNADLTIAINGSGNVRVKSGQVNQLDVKLNGSGQIVLDIQAESALLALSGAGSINVKSVRERPRINLAGAGIIKVNNW